jgi:hypothetical protein
MESSQDSAFLVFWAITHRYYRVPTMTRSATFTSLTILATLFALIVVVAGKPPRMAGAADHPIPEPLKQPPPSKFECRWTDTPISIDGNGSNPAWKQAQPIAAFHLPWLGEKARMARTATTAKLL